VGARMDRQARDERDARGGHQDEQPVEVIDHPE
jgi:hypothetical protein